MSKTIDHKRATLDELLGRYRQSDPEAFKEFFERTNGLIFGYLKVKLRNHADAQDVLQDTFLRIHKYIASYDPTRVALSWVFAVAHRALLDHLKVRKRLPLLQEAQVLATLSSQPAADEFYELREYLMATCLDLSASDRQLLYDRVVNEFTYDEIATTNGISTENARQRVSRMLKKLKSRTSITS